MAGAESICSVEEIGEKEEEQEILQLENVCAMHDLPKPEITLLIRGKPHVFLCDSGACRTVLRQTIPGVKFSNQTILVRSANGCTDSQQLTEPVNIADPETGTTVCLPLVISPKCPFNLLGRDGLTGLNLCILPRRKGGMGVARIQNPEHLLVQQGVGEPNFYWTLDIANKPPINTATALLKRAELYLNPYDKNVDVMSPEDLHITVRYKRTPGPDPIYEKHFHKLGPQKVTLCYILTDGKKTAVASASLSTEAFALFQGPYPVHVSLAKPKDKHWKDLGAFMQKAKFVTDWGLKDGIFYSPSTDLWKIPLNWVASTSPQTHLKDETSRSD